MADLGRVADGYTLNMHPMAFAAWFGLLATALNLFPIGQLDGGHISYAVLGRRSIAITLGDDRRRDRADVFLIELARLDDPDDGDDRGCWARIIRRRSTTTSRSVAAGCRSPGFALLMLIVCFTPAPIGRLVERKTCGRRRL